jgi:hypothetical protein
MNFKNFIISESVKDIEGLGYPNFIAKMFYKRFNPKIATI